MAPISVRSKLFLWFRKLSFRRHRPSRPSLDSLPDVVLLHILDLLPSYDLLHLRNLNTRWYTLVSSAACRRQTLYLTDDTWPIEHVTSDYTFSNVHYLRQADGSPVVPPIANVQPDKLPVHLYKVPPGSEPFSYFLPTFGQLAYQLAALFPNIHHLVVSMKKNSETLAIITCLLEAWGPTLTRLNLCYRIKDTPEAPGYPELDVLPRDYQQKTELLLRSVFKAINNLSHLRHLNLSIGTGDNFQRLPSSSPFTLPIIGQLESFTYTSKFFVSLLDLDLLQQVVDQYNEKDEQASLPLLQHVAIFNYVTMEMLNQVDDQLAYRFTCLNLVDLIGMDNLPAFRRLCGRFTSLLHLSVNCSIRVHRLVEAMQPMARLMHLTLRHVGRNVRSTRQRPEPLRSVLSLHLQTRLRRHSQLENFNLDRLFPSVQVAAIVNEARYCDDCNYDVTLNAHFNRRLIAKCDNSYWPYLQGLKKLRFLNQQVRIDWREWESDILLTWP